jgi:hypothetical protein
LRVKSHNCIQSLLKHTARLEQEVKTLTIELHKFTTQPDSESTEPSYTPALIQNHIEHIGIKIIDFGCELASKHDHISSNFAVNRAGFIAINCRYDLDSHDLLLYKPTGELGKKCTIACCPNSGSAVGISEDLIFIASYNKHDSIKHGNFFYVDAYNFQLVKVKSFADRLSPMTSEIDHIAGNIDFNNNLIYVKIQINGGTNKKGTTVAVYVFDTKLNNVDMFVIEETSKLRCRLRVNNGLITYIREKDSDLDYDEIIFRSLESKQVLRKLDFNKHLNIDFDTCLNESLITLAFERDNDDDDDDCLLIKDYDHNGKLKQSTRLNIRLHFDGTLMSSQPRYRMSITNPCHFAIMSVDESLIFLN